MTLLAARFGLAAPLLVGACALRDPAALRRSPKEVGLLLLQGAVGYGTPALLAFLALRITDGAVFSALYFTFPLWVALGTALVYREPLGARQGAALVLAVGGSALAAGLLEDAATGSRPAAGIALSLAAALAYATYVVSSQRVLGRIAPLAVAGYSMLGCALLFLALRAARGGPLPAPGALAATAALMALAATALPLACFLAGVRRLGASRSAVVAAVEPVFTALLLYATLGERLGASQGAGVVAIVAGVALVTGAPAGTDGREGCR